MPIFVFRMSHIVYFLICQRTYAHLLEMAVSDDTSSFFILPANLNHRIRTYGNCLPNFRPQTSPSDGPPCANACIFLHVPTLLLLRDKHWICNCIVWRWPFVEPFYYIHTSFSFLTSVNFGFGCVAWNLFHEHVSKLEIARNAATHLCLVIFFLNQV